MKRGVFRRRKFWWTDPGVAAIVIGFSVILIPVSVYLDSFGNHVATGVFVLTFGGLVVTGILWIRSVRGFSLHAIVAKKVHEAEQEIRVGRQNVRREFIQTELDRLAQGKPGPVLDIWRLDPVLERRHPFFSAIEYSVLDPLVKELQFRFSLGEAEGENLPVSRPNLLLKQFYEFLRIAADDGYLAMLLPFFETAVLEIYQDDLDTSNRRIHHPVVSLVIEKRQLQEVLRNSETYIDLLRKRGNLRFAEGAVIVPHRGLAPLSSRGGK